MGCNCSSSQPPLTPVYTLPVPTDIDKLLEKKTGQIEYEQSDIKDLPEFRGPVHQRGQPGYTGAAYQYASSSFAALGVTQPAVIIYAQDDDDVIRAITYAREHDIAIAIRTGGHHFSAASSTYGKNLQLDLSETYNDFNWDNEDCTQVTVGVSWPLKAFSDMLAQRNRFIPHGRGNYVRIGGQAQTGGFGQCGRSFGLFSDYITRLRIINAEGVVQVVEKGVDVDMFFAMIGGSPGNFGVLTHVTMSVFKDEDYPQSRGFKGVYFYTPDVLEKLTDILVEMAMDLPFPADFDYSVTMMSSHEALLPTIPTSVQNALKTMCPEKYPNDTTPPIILVCVQWANLDGAGQVYDPSFVSRIKLAAGDPIPLIGVLLNDDQPIPMSKLMPHWSFDAHREYALPYVKRAYLSNSMTLTENGWAKWLVGRIEALQKVDNNGCKIVMQLQNFGGNDSQFFQKGLEDSTALSWRDSHLACVLDCFHERTPNAKAAAETWSKGNDEGVGPDGKFCSFDRRLLWGAYDTSLPTVRKHYYENGAKYERLVNIKNLVDPKGVFTPNEFCVGAPLRDSEQPTALSESAASFVQELDDKEMATKLLPRIHKHCQFLTGGRVGVAGDMQGNSLGQYQLGEALNRVVVPKSDTNVNSSAIPPITPYPVSNKLSVFPTPVEAQYQTFH